MTRRDGFEHEYPPGEWTVERVERVLRETTGDDGTPDTDDLPTYADEAVWERLRTDELTRPHVEALLAEAADQRGAPVPRLPASEYLEFVRTGDRYSYQDPEWERLDRLTRFAVAECLERDGDYLDDVLDYAWAVCEQTAWVLPAHLRDAHGRDGLPGVVDDEERTVALHTTWIAALLAEVDHLLGDRLHPALRERIRTEVDRRVVTPYLARDDHQWLTPPSSNWNAVCNGGLIVAAVRLLDDPERAARVVTKASHTLERYLADFDADGCTAEGITYWNYGFGHYVAAAAALSARTDGELSLLSPPVVPEIAEFPLAVELSPGQYVPFSDAEFDARVSPGVVSRLGTALDHEGLGALGRRSLAERGPYADEPRNMTGLRDLLWTVEVPADWEAPTPPRRRFFAGHEWWFARADPSDPDGLVVAAKGGHNNESHNQNDCGSFVVHYRGESLLTDLGRPDYDRDYFDDSERYDYLTARSLGHSVPYVGGHEQAHGAGYAAEVVDREGDESGESLALEIAGCYPAAAGLESLRRSVTLDRSGPSVRVADAAAFDGTVSDPSFESILVSYLPMEVSGDALVVTGERGRATVEPEPAGTPIDVERLPEAVQGRDVWRARIGPVEGGGDDTAELSLDVDLEPV